MSKKPQPLCQLITCKSKNKCLVQTCIVFFSRYMYCTCLTFERFMTLFFFLFCLTIVATLKWKLLRYWLCWQCSVSKCVCIFKDLLTIPYILDIPRPQTKLSGAQTYRLKKFLLFPTMHLSKRIISRSLSLEIIKTTQMHYVVVSWLLEPLWLLQTWSFHCYLPRTIQKVEPMITQTI